MTLRSEHAAVVVVISSHQSHCRGVSRFRSAQSITIPLSVCSASILPAHRIRKSEHHCRYRPLRHQNGDIRSRESSEVLAADSVGRRSGR